MAVLIPRTRRQRFDLMLSALVALMCLLWLIESIRQPTVTAGHEQETVGKP